MGEDYALFGSSVKEGDLPLAERIRPASLSEIVGFDHIISRINERLNRKPPPSFIIWGPPGSGKTTLGLAICREISDRIFTFSASVSHIKDIKNALEDAVKIKRLEKKYACVFIDEVHRLNRAQQDVLLPYLEKREVVVVCATTENPSFALRNALMSRLTLIVLKRPDAKVIKEILLRALNHPQGLKGTRIEGKAMDAIVEACDGDIRVALSLLESTFLISGKNYGDTITFDDVAKAIEDKKIYYDKSGEEHYNLISAFIKSMRGSNPDAAVYYLARMLEGGEDPLYILRRMLIFAAEDIGNADPNALTVAVSAYHAFEKVGMPEGWIPIVQAVIYLATAPKSRESYNAYLRAVDEVRRSGTLPVPMHLRNAPTGLMKKLGYGKQEGDYDGFLPEKIKDAKFYTPSDSGYEREIRERMSSYRDKDE